MSATILLLVPDAEKYAALLEPDFPGVNFIQHSSADARAGMELFPEADAIIARGHGFDAACLARCTRLKWFQCTMTGTDHLAPVLKGSKVVLTNGRGNHGTPMTEMALLHMFAFYKSIPEIVHTREERRSDRPKIRVLANRTVCIVGVGAIAEHAAKVFQALGMRVTGVSRSPRLPEGFDRIFPRTELLAAAAEADFLLLLIPYDRTSEGIIDDAVFAAMKPGAVLINLARGGVVDEPAMIRALQEGRIAGAGLDVYSQFPLPPESPLWGMKNVFMTPNTAGQSDQGIQSSMRIMKPNVRAFLDGNWDAMVNRVAL